MRCAAPPGSDPSAEARSPAVLAATARARRGAGVATLGAAGGGGGVMPSGVMIGSLGGAGFAIGIGVTTIGSAAAIAPTNSTTASAPREMDVADILGYR